MLEILILLVGFIVALEVAWRLFKWGTTGKLLLCQAREEQSKAGVFQGHPYSLYCKRQNIRGLYPSNNLGYAGVRDYTVERLPNSVRILVVGGSTAENHAPEYGLDSSWPAMLEDRLNELFPDVTVEVINAGLAGYSSVESTVDFMLKGLELKPDILVIYHNINDVLTIQMADGFKADYSHVREAKSWSLPWVHGIPTIPFLFSYEYLRQALIRKFGFANTILERISSPPWKSEEPFDASRVEVFKRNIRSLAGLAHAAGCVPCIVKWECPWETEGVYPWAHLMIGDEQALGDKYFKYIKANNVALKELGADLEYSRYVDVGPFEKKLFRPDNLHFIGQGMDEMAGRMATALAPLVTEVLEYRRQAD